MAKAIIRIKRLSLIHIFLHLKNSPETAGEGVNDALGGWTEQISCVVEKAHGALD